MIAVDGAALAGADAETVGMEWGEPLSDAVASLQKAGHAHIGFATTDHLFLANQLGMRRLRHLHQQALPGISIEAITVSRLPGDGYEEAFVEQMKAIFASTDRPPMTALVAWGIEDGAKFRRLMHDAGIDITSRLSVVLLGRVDLANEHSEFFDTVGCKVSEQIESLDHAITARWADPSLPKDVKLSKVIWVTMTGAQLESYLRQAARMTPGSGAFAQTSGVRWADDGGLRTRLLINGRAIDAAQAYRLAVNSFVARGGDGYPDLGSHPGFTNTGWMDVEVLREFITRRSTVFAKDFAPTGP